MGTEIVENVPSNDKSAAISARLAAILGRQCHIDAKMSGIGRSLAGLQAVRRDAERLSQTIEQTTLLAENVSAKVRRLDEARTRVSDCQQRLHDLIDLQLCASGVTAAIRSDDFELAASHIDRFLGMDRALLQRTATGNGSSIAEAVKTLDAAAEKLRDSIRQRFAAAVARDDIAAVERHFRLFPMLRMHDDGIAMFGDFVCAKLQAKAARELRTAVDVAKANNRSTLAYADTLTAMFENLARVVEVNQATIESCYGHGYLCRMVLRMQRECDEQFRRLLADFQTMRRIGHRMTQIDEQLTSKTAKASSSSLGSGANDSATATGASAGKGHQRQKSGSSLDKLNPKDIDGLLIELAVMLSRVVLYERFMRRKVTDDLEASALTVEQRTAQLKLFDEALLRSDLSRQQQELLNIYLLFERYFIEESVLKAIALDTVDADQPCSSMVDDVFFILRKSIRRAASTQSLNGCCAVINNATSVLDTDFVQVIHATLRAGYPSGYIDLAAHAYQALHSSIQSGGKLPGNQDISGDRARANFIVQLNNADQAAQHADTLCQQMTGEIRAALKLAAGRDSDMLDSCLVGLRALNERMRAEVEFGLQQLRSSVLRPRLHTWIVDQFCERSHALSEDEFAAYQTSDETFVKSLIGQLDGLLGQFRPVMAERNYDALVAMLAADVTARMEAAVRKCTFNRLGGLVLDQEVRALSLFLSGATSWSVRDKMVRLTQMATLLNLERVSELTEYMQPTGDQHSSIGGPTWHFSHAEVKGILSLRSDFRTSDIKRLKL